MPALDPQQWQQVQRILDELDAVPVAARVDRLASMPITDEVVRREAQSLLAAEIRQGDFLEASPYATGNDGVAPPSLQAGQVLGSFRIEQLVGRGGMAEVYRARRVGDFEQIVAIKLISSAAHERVEFFQRERRILATLEHPGIARIIDGGVTESGRPYMVMEFVDGTDLVSHAQERRLDLRARLALFRQVCEAVAFAHQHLVVHRDLKPGNVRVTPEGQVKLLDFGIAKLLDVERRDERLQTAVVFTPEFAAPEQLHGDGVTIATDVYALGGMLLYLLTGSPPFDTRGQPLHLAIDQLLRSEPPRPSAVAQQLSHPPVPPAQLRGDLDAIIQKAMRRTPAERYPGAAELWADVERHLTHLPVQAAGQQWSYLARRFLRRNALPLAAGAAVVAALVLGLLSTLWQAREARAAEREAQDQAQRVKRSKDFFVSVFAGASTFKRVGDAPLTLNEAVDLAIARVDSELAGDPAFQASLLTDFGEIRAGQGDFESARTMFQRALEIQDKVLDPSDPALALTLNNRGAIETYIGENEAAAVPYLERAIAILQRHPGLANELANSRSGLATVYLNNDQAEKALELLAPLLAFVRRSPGEQELQLADTLTRLASAHYDLGRIEAAAADAREALEVYTRNFGPRSVHRIAPLRMLARIAADTGQAPEAHRLAQEALDLARLNNPRGHPDRLSALRLLASAAVALDREAEAEAHYRAVIDEARDQTQEHLGVEAAADLALLQVRRDALVEARGTLAQSASTCQTRERVEVANACDYVRLLGLLIDLRSGGPVAAALAPATVLVAGLGERGATDPRRASALMILGDLQMAASEPAQAVARFAEASDLSPGSAEIRRRHVEALAASGEVAAAEAQYNTLAELPDRPSTAAQRDLARAALALARGDTAAATQAQRAALSRLETLGPYYAGQRRALQQRLSTAAP